MAAIPKAWQELMDQQGISSIRQLAKVADLPDHSAINRVIMKGTSTSEENMIKVARALKVSVEELYRITSGVAARPLTMPAGTEKLSERQKNAVAEIIRTMIEEKEYVEMFVDKKTGDPAESVQEKIPARAMSAQEQHELAARRRLFPGESDRRAGGGEKPR
ncbi:helix-turn-helix domain-containing protein [Arthrobacter liuii]|nr:helix-turn-helix transcriptional regulator [Arthrobacter liuii]